LRTTPFSTSTIKQQQMSVDFDRLMSVGNHHLMGNRLWLLHLVV